MPGDLSPRLAEIVDALPLTPESRVLEIGCGPGAAARAVAARLTSGHILAVDRSARAVAQARAGSAAQIASGRMSVRRASAEDFVREPGEGPFDIVFAVRVGALDGRHPEEGRRALERIADALARAAGSSSTAAGPCARSRCRPATGERRTAEPSGAGRADAAVCPRCGAIRPHRPPTTAERRAAELPGGRREARSGRGSGAHPWYRESHVRRTRGRRGTGPGPRPYGRTVACPSGAGKSGCAGAGAGGTVPACLMLTVTSERASRPTTTRRARTCSGRRWSAPPSTCWPSWPATARPSNSASAPAGSRSRWPAAESPCTASTCPAPWCGGCAPSPAATPSG